MFYQNLEVPSTRCHQELEKKLASLNYQVVDLHKQINMKDWLIESLKQKLCENEYEMLKMQIENKKQDMLMIDASCNTNDLIQVVDIDMIYCSFTSYDMDLFTFIKSELIKIGFDEDKPQEKYCMEKNSMSEYELEKKIMLQKKTSLNVWKQIKRLRMIFPK